MFVIDFLKDVVSFWGFAPERCWGLPSPDSLVPPTPVIIFKLAAAFVRRTDRPFGDQRKHTMRLTLVSSRRFLQQRLIVQLYLTFT